MNFLFRSVPTSLLRHFLFVAFVCLAGCASRPGPEILKATAVSTPVPGTKIIKVYVATTRSRATSGGNVFTNDRSMKLNYAEFTVSVPPTHKAGKIEWPSSKPDPKTSFVTVGQRQLDQASFKSEVEKRGGAAKVDVNVFVHGFNNNLQEALFRLVQMSADSGDQSVPILFAWPSDASVTGYVADKDAATFSRDSLADLLTMLARNADIGGIDVLSHSMGAWLTTEALRQLKLTRQDSVIHRLRVVLAAPDIDTDVFRAQLGVIGPLSPPMTLLVSQDDRALAFSSLISGERLRLGALDVNDPVVQRAAEIANVQVIDISGFSPNDDFKHSRFSELAVMFPKLAAQETSDSGQNLRRAGAFVFNSVGATLASPFTLAGKAVSGN